jgi:hypothetical protein
MNTRGGTYYMLIELMGILVVVVLFGVVRSKSVSKEYEPVVVKFRYMNETAPLIHFDFKETWKHTSPLKRPNFSIACLPRGYVTVWSSGAPRSQVTYE